MSLVHTCANFEKYTCFIQITSKKGFPEKAICNLVTFEMYLFNFFLKGKLVRVCLNKYCVEGSKMFCIKPISFKMGFFL